MDGCDGSGPSYKCWVQTQNGNAPLFYHSGGLYKTLPENVQVEITCWYYGDNAGWLPDGYEDHVVWVNTVGDFSGHIPDDYINEGGKTPNEFKSTLPGENIPNCDNADAG